MPKYLGLAARRRHRTGRGAPLHFRCKTRAGEKHIQSGRGSEKANAEDTDANRRGFAKARIRRKTAEFTESNAENPSTLQVLPTYFSFIFILAFFQKIRMFKIIGAVQNIFAAGSIRHGFGTRQIKNICKARSAYGERKTPMLDRIALILVIIGAINWGSIGLFRFDIVGWLFGGAGSVLSRIIFSVVALAGLWCISLLFRRRAESRE